MDDVVDPCLQPILHRRLEDLLQGRGAPGELGAKSRNLVHVRLALSRLPLPLGEVVHVADVEGESSCRRAILTEWQSSAFESGRQPCYDVGLVREARHAEEVSERGVDDFINPQESLDAQVALGTYWPGRVEADELV